MIVAVTYDNGNIFQHFGKCSQFKVVRTRDNVVVSSGILYANGSGHSSLATLLKQNDVEAVICGGIGPGAQNALKENGIALYAGVSGNVDEAIDALLNGTLNYGTVANCDHHH